MLYTVLGLDGLFGRYVIGRCSRARSELYLGEEGRKAASVVSMCCVLPDAVGVWAFMGWRHDGGGWSLSQMHVAYCVLFSGLRLGARCAVLCALRIVVSRLSGGFDARAGGCMPRKGGSLRSAEFSLSTRSAVCWLCVGTLR